MQISCADCTVRGLACQDCVVTLLLSLPNEQPEFSIGETTALQAMAESGLLPPLRMVRGG